MVRSKDAWKLFLQLWEISKPSHTEMHVNDCWGIHYPSKNQKPLRMQDVVRFSLLLAICVLAEVIYSRVWLALKVFISVSSSVRAIYLAYSFSRSLEGCQPKGKHAFIHARNILAITNAKIPTHFLRHYNKMSRARATSVVPVRG